MIGDPGRFSPVGPVLTSAVAACAIVLLLLGPYGALALKEPTVTVTVPESYTVVPSASPVKVGPDGIAVNEGCVKQGASMRCRRCLLLCVLVPFQRLTSTVACQNALPEHQVPSLHGLGIDTVRGSGLYRTSEMRRYTCYSLPITGAAFIPAVSLNPAEMHHLAYDVKRVIISYQSY